MPDNYNCFIPFNVSLDNYSIPKHLNNPFNYIPDPLCILAAKEVQNYLNHNTDLEHNFGLGDKKLGIGNGKMFGVMVVKDKNEQIGYLMAFSGKLSGENILSKFVPPVGQKDRDVEFVNRGMTELSHINFLIKELEKNIDIETPLGKAQSLAMSSEIVRLKEKRKNNSQQIQKHIFSEFKFMNSSGEQKNLLSIFGGPLQKSPPAGAGECAAPKLLQYAFEAKMTPIAMAEFWWGKSRKSQNKRHGEFYPSCLDKCQPILVHMLQGLNLLC